MAKTLKRKNTFKGKTVADYKGKTPREVGLKYETAGKSVADDKKMAYWLAANKPEGTRRGLIPFVNSKGQLDVASNAAYSNTGVEKRAGYGSLGRKEFTQETLKEIGRTSRRSAMTNNGVNKAKKLRSERWNDNVVKFGYEVTPVVERMQGKEKQNKANVKLLTKQALKNKDFLSVPSGITTYGRSGLDYIEKPFKTTINSWDSKKGKTIRTGKVGIMKLDKRPANERFSNTQGRRLNDLKAEGETKPVRSLGAGRTEINKKYGVPATQLKTKIVSEKALHVRPDRKVTNGRYTWTDITPNDKSGYERALTADDRKRYMKKKLAERKGK